MGYLEGGDVAEYAIAKSGSRNGGARQRHNGIAHEPPIEPRVRASHGKGNTASREVISTALSRPPSSAPATRKSSRYFVTIFL
jgi:hypothetical protein